MQNFLNGAHQTDTDSNNILNVLCIILSAYLDIFSFTYTTSHKTDVHHKSLDMFIGVCLCMEVLAASCCCRSYTLCTLDYVIHSSGTFMVHFVSLFVVSICLLHIVFATIIYTSIDSNSCTTTTLSIWYSSHIQVT